MKLSQVKSPPSTILNDARDSNHWQIKHAFLCLNTAFFRSFLYTLKSIFLNKRILCTLAGMVQLVGASRGCWFNFWSEHIPRWLVQSRVGRQLIDISPLTPFSPVFVHFLLRALVCIHTTTPGRGDRPHGDRPHQFLLSHFQSSKVSLHGRDLTRIQSSFPKVMNGLSLQDANVRQGTSECRETSATAFEN